MPTIFDKSIWVIAVLTCVVLVSLFGLFYKNQIANRRKRNRHIEDKVESQFATQNYSDDNGKKYGTVYSIRKKKGRLVWSKDSKIKIPKMMLKAKRKKSQETTKRLPH